jgi:hypothetical protein
MFAMSARTCSQSVQDCILVKKSASLRVAEHSVSPTRHARLSVAPLPGENWAPNGRLTQEWSAWHSGRCVSDADRCNDNKPLDVQAKTESSQLWGAFRLTPYGLSTAAPKTLVPVWISHGGDDGVRRHLVLQRLWILWPRSRRKAMTVQGVVVQSTSNRYWLAYMALADA